MALKSVQWVFYNEENANDKIVIQDHHSASVLSEVLKSHKDVWVMKEEYASAQVTPAPSVNKSSPLSTPLPIEKAEISREIQSTHLTRSEVTPPALKAPLKSEILAEDRRTQKRFNVDLRIILISKGRSFRSISQDVSLGGMKLKNKVPVEFSAQECVAYISNADSKENIEMVCQVIADPSDSRRVQFTNADAQQLKRLSKWLSENQVVKKAS